MVRIHNLETDEIIDREMNDEEFAEFQSRQQIQKQKDEAEAAKLAARSALFEKLGITEDEAKLLLS
jgi:hypothetical protein